MCTTLINLCVFRAWYRVTPHNAWVFFFSFLFPPPHWLCWWSALQAPLPYFSHVGCTGVGGGLELTWPCSWFPAFPRRPIWYAEPGALLPRNEYLQLWNFQPAYIYSCLYSALLRFFGGASLHFSFLISIPGLVPIFSIPFLMLLLSSNHHTVNLLGKTWNKTATQCQSWRKKHIQSCHLWSKCLNCPSYRKEQELELDVESTKQRLILGLLCSALSPGIDSSPLPLLQLISKFLPIYLLYLERRVIVLLPLSFLTTTLVVANHGNTTGLVTSATLSPCCPLRNMHPVISIKSTYNPYSFNHFNLSTFRKSQEPFT